MSEELDPKMALWNRVFMTDPKAVKKITGKSYQGNSPKPYYLIEAATKEFGACGEGWGVEVVSERFDRVSDTDTLHSATVRFWYMKDGKRCSVEQMGGTKASYMTSKGSLMVDEDAGKKSVTDGMVKCMSMIGFAGDIFSGRWDDSKYVAEAKEHFAPVITPRGGIGADLPDEWKSYLTDLAASCTDLCAKGQAVDALEMIRAAELEDDQRIWLADQMDSKTRAALKAAKPQKEAA